MKKLVMVCLSIIVSGCNFEYNPLGHGDEVVNRDGAPGELNTPAPQGGVDIGEFLIDNVSSTTGAQERLTGSCITGQDVVLTSDDLNPNPQLYPCPSNGKIDTLVTFKTGISKTVTIIASTEGEPDIPIIIIVDTQGPDPLVVTAPADDSTTPENQGTFVGTCEAGATVNITGSVVPSPTTGLCASNGTFSIPVVYTVGDGSKVMDVTQTDQAGNTSPVVVITVNVIDSLCTIAALSSPTIILGSGTYDLPYIICNVDQLQLMNSDLFAFYELGYNIDASATSAWTTGTSGTGFIPIGSCGADYNCSTGQDPFRGSFNGNGFSIDNLFINRTRETVGLFGETSASAVITNVRVTNASVTGVGNTGGLVGRLVGVLLDSFFGGSVSGSTKTGGLVGDLPRARDGGAGTMHNLSTQATVSCSGPDCGGAVGYLNSGTHVSEVHTAGSVVGSDMAVGGVAGRAHDGEIHASSSKSTVSGTTRIGGLVGHQYYNELVRSFASGNVTGSGNLVGGAVGFQQYYGKAYDVFATGNVSGVDSVGGFSGQSDYYARTRRTFASGDVDASDLTGAFAGRVTDASSKVDDSFATGTVTGTGADVGGFIGSVATPANITNTLYDDNDGTFFGSAHAVYTAGSAWDFSGGTADGERDIWYASATALPRFTTLADMSISLSGSGTEVDPYLLTTPTEFQSIKATAMLRAHYKLANDLDFTGVTLTPIGDNNFPFTGSIDGGGFSMMNLTQDAAGSGLALFDEAIGASFKNLNLTNFNITNGGSYTAALVGECRACIIEDLTATGISISGTTGSLYQGALVGRAYSTTFKNVSLTGTITSQGDVIGGFVGWSDAARIYGCAANVTISGTGLTGSTIGGFLGYTERSWIISSHTSGTISGKTNVGGLIGRALQTRVEKSYSTADVTASNEIAGGLVGRGGEEFVVEGTAVFSSYATGTISGGPKRGGLIGEAVNGTSITDSYATSNLPDNIEKAGGLIGEVSTGTVDITNSYASGNLGATTADNIGGLVGAEAPAGTDPAGVANVINSFATGSVTSTGANVSGLVGTGGNVLNSLHNATESVFYNSAHAVYVGTPSWDFTNIWNTPSSALPTLQ